jgi:tripartite-type tricarboxylate transporter receptor subunit TctC
MKHAFLTAACVLAAAFAAPSGHAQAYPSRPVTLVVGSPPGSATDIVSRKFAEHLRAKHGATVIIDNKPGGDGNIAAQSALRAPADGYTVFMTGNSVHGANVNLFKELPFDPIRDFDMIGGVTASPLVLTVRPDFPANNVAEFIAELKKRQKPAFFGTSGASTRGASELFKQRTGLPIDNVTYRGAPQVITDLFAGQFEFAFIDINTVRPFLQDGKLKGLGISSAKRHTALPNIPAIAETLKDFEFRAWIGVVVRAKTPPDVVIKLSMMLQEYVNDAATISFVHGLGSQPLPLDGRQFKDFVEAETKIWADIVRTANIEKK